MIGLPCRLWPAWLLLLPALVFAKASALPSIDDAVWTTRYDGYFRKYAKHYFGPSMDWRWFKAQAIVESGLNPNARGPNGAIGIMQILPSTFAEIRKKNPHFLRLDDPRWSIAAGIHYDRQTHREWLKLVKPTAAWYLTLASYNAGAGRMRRAYKKLLKQGQTLSWSHIVPHIPKITRHYVERIHKLMGAALD